MKHCLRRKVSITIYIIVSKMRECSILWMKIPEIEHFC